MDAADLDLAIAVAAAEGSDDDDFQQCRKSLALTKQQFLMKSTKWTEKAPTKRGASSQDRKRAGAKSRKCSAAGGSFFGMALSVGEGKGVQMGVKGTVKGTANAAEALVVESADSQSDTIMTRGLPHRPGLIREMITAGVQLKTEYMWERPPSFQTDVSARDCSPLAVCSRSGTPYNQSTSLPGNESQLNVLLSLCSEAAGQLVSPDAGQPSRERRTSGAVSNVEQFENRPVDDVTVSQASVISDEEDVISLMTQDYNPKKDEDERQNRGEIVVSAPLRDISNSSALPAALNSDRAPFQVTQTCRQVEQASITDLPLNEFIPECPICRSKLGSLSVNELEAHTNACLDKLDSDKQDETVADSEMAPVLQWLKELKLSKYFHLFVKEEVDWDTLPWLQDEDLERLGITALGPRRKIMSAIGLLKSAKDSTGPSESKVGDSERNPCSDKRITDFFIQDNMLGKPAAIAKPSSLMRTSAETAKNKNKGILPVPSNRRSNRVAPPVQPWMCIPGTTFRVDAFRHLTTDCSHWFLTHFHTDHYQGLTRGFRHGKIYCSPITAALVTMQIGVPTMYLEVVHLNRQVTIDGIRVTFLDANHCPGSVMILFELPNNDKILHTGDFRYCSKMVDEPALQSNRIQTLILDTTYCSPQYDFPEQGAAVQFVIDAIQAEAFNPKTLFLIGTYTIGKERVYLEVARALGKKVYVGSAKRRLLSCMKLDEDTMKWLTCNDRETQIHVVPLWSIASFKRMASISRHYQAQYNSVVAFSLTGWNFGRDKRRLTTGRRKQQGTIVRYEVPYSDHSSFVELQQFVAFVKPRTIIPSVVQNETAEMVVARLLNR